MICIQRKQKEYKTLGPSFHFMSSGFSVILTVLFSVHVVFLFISYCMAEHVGPESENVSEHVIIFVMYEMKVIH